MEELDLKTEYCVKNVVLVKKLVNWKDKSTGLVSQYYAWVLRVHNGDKVIDVKITEPSGKLKTLDEVGYITYEK